jgi:hypothetical protein
LKDEICSIVEEKTGVTIDQKDILAIREFLPATKSIID